MSLVLLIGLVTGVAVAGWIIGYAWRAFPEPVFVCLHRDCGREVSPKVGYCTLHLLHLSIGETVMKLGAQLLEGEDPS